MEAEFARLETETKNAFRAAKRIAKNQGAEEYNMVKLLGETRQEELGRAMAGEHRAYLKATSARTEVCEGLIATVRARTHACAHALHARACTQACMQACNCDQGPTAAVSMH